MAPQRAIKLQQFLRAITSAIKEAAAGVERENTEPPSVEFRRASVTLMLAIEESQDGEAIRVRVEADHLKSLPEHAVSQLSFELDVTGEAPPVES